MSEVAEVMNPRGSIAKELEQAARRGHWVSVVCEHWLTFCDDNVDRAAHTTPYELPAVYPYAARLKKAIQLSGMFESSSGSAPTVKVRKNAKNGTLSLFRGGRNADNPESIPVSTPSWASRLGWEYVFDHWHSGALRRSIDVIFEMLPKENRESIRKEMLK